MNLYNYYWYFESAIPPRICDLIVQYGKAEKQREIMAITGGFGRDRNLDKQPLTKDEIKEMGFENLTKDFIEHMRAQSVNEVTATKDLNYVRNKDFSYKGKQAFGRLTQAWDNSKEAGTGFLDGLGDFAEGAITAPSTYLGFASFGLGKVGAKVASKGVQLAVRALSV